MLRWRFTNDSHPRTKNGHPPHKTTGVVSTNWIQYDSSTEISSGTMPGTISAPMASISNGRAKATLTQKRRDMSVNSALSSGLATGVIGSSAMPQIGQLPGPSRTISGCIGQVYLTAFSIRGCAGSSDMPHFGQFPGLFSQTSGCIGQMYSLPDAILPVLHGR